MKEKDNDLCSICCLSYNHAKYIKQAIQSFWDQNYKNIEIIAIDDGSSDKSAPVLEELKTISPCPMQVISQENTGNIGLNFNRAFKKASGKYIAIIALDDQLTQDAISKKIELMEKDDSIIFIANSKIQGIDANGKFNNLVDPMKLDEIENPTYQDLLDLEYNHFHSYYLQGSVIKKEVIEKIGGFDEDMLGDDIVLRTKLARYVQNNLGTKFVILKDIACYYRLHDNNISSNSYRQILIVTQYLDKYWENYKNPKAYNLWVKYMIGRVEKDLLIKVFKLKRAKIGLLNPRVIWRLLARGYFFTLLVILKNNIFEKNDEDIE